MKAWYARRSVGGKILFWIAALIALYLFWFLVLGRLAATPSSAAVPHARATQQQADKHGMSHRKQVILRKMVRAYRHHHHKRFRHLRRQFGKTRLPYRSHVHRVGCTKAKYCAKPKRGSACAVGYLTVTSNADVIGSRLFTTEMNQKYCWRHGHLTKVGKANISGDVSGFASAFGWSDHDSGTAVNLYRHHHRSHTTVKEEIYEQCLPLPTGCGFPRDSTVYMTMKTHGDGTWNT